jgi:branched-chain amino acid transport system substrate-binding protein
MSARMSYVLAVVLAAGLSPSNSAHRESVPAPIRIGVVLATSGPAKQYGEPAWRGVQLAAEEWNRSAGTTRPQIDLVFHDSRTQPGVAARAMHQLADQNIAAVIGDVSSDTALAMAAVAERRGIVMLSPGASAAALSSHGTYVFRIWHSDEHEAEEDAVYAYKVLGWRHVTVMFSDDEAYGRGLADGFTKHFTKLGGQVRPVPVDRRRANFRRELDDVKRTKTNGIFLAAYTDQMLQILEQKIELGIQLPVLAVQAFENVDLKSEAVNKQVVFFSTVKPPKETAEVKRFRAAYRRKWGIDPSLCSDSGYDAVNILAEVLSDGAATPAAVKDALEHINHDGAAGQTKFDAEHRDVQKQIDFKIVRDGVAVLASNSRGGRVSSPAAMRLWDRIAQALGPNLFMPVVVAVLTAIALGLLSLVRERLFKWMRWLRVRWSIRYQLPSRQADVRFGTIDDYVHIATKLRENAVAECRASKAKKPVLVIHAFTLQSPRDWPLFHADEEDVKIASPIDEYFLEFQKFIANSRNADYDLCIKRVVVIEHAADDHRLDELSDIVNSPTFDRYIALLHKEEADAFYYEQEGAWPNDVADAIFYGVLENGSTRWLSGVTTNYRGNGGVIAMRLHKLGKRRELRRMHMPFHNMKSLEHFAEQAGNTQIGMKPLASLKTIARRAAP